MLKPRDTFFSKYYFRCKPKTEIIIQKISLFLLYQPVMLHFFRVKKKKITKN